MATIDGWMSVARAAEELGVSAERVRELVAAGRLDAVKPARNLLVSAEAVRRRLHVEKPRLSQPWSARMAWAVLALASGQRPGWVSSSELVRARRYVQRPLDQWPWSLAKRSGVHRVRVPAALVQRLTRLPDVSIGGVDAANEHGAGLVASDDVQLELYVRGDTFVGLKEMRGVGWESHDPNVTLRVLPSCVADNVLEGVLVGRYVPKAVAAADLLDRGDERSNRAAAELMPRS